MVLIADSGSTKTDWLIGQTSVRTQGLNPVHLSEAQIMEAVRQELLPQIDPEEVSSVYFYGSGVRPELEGLMADVLRQAFPKAAHVEAHSDMLGAARALCGSSQGIACILGTGANSCVYDGSHITGNSPALGYILGDDGSGAALGRRLLRCLYKGVFRKEIVSNFEEETGLSVPTIINKVYRQPMPNRFLASLSEYVGRHLSDFPEFQAMVRANFLDFIDNDILPYRRIDLPVSFVGSIAWFYERQLREAADIAQLEVGVVCRSPLQGLVEFHKNLKHSDNEN